MLFGPGKTSGDLHGQVAVVGTGPAGLAIALALGEAGHRVIVLESGHETPDRFAAALGAASEVPAGHAKPGESRTRRFGGASAVWGGRCVTYDPIDFEPRPGMQASGWPISYADAMQHADRAAAFLGIGRAIFDRSPGTDLDVPAFGVTLERWCAEPRLDRRHGLAVRKSKNVSVHLGLTCTGADVDGSGQVRALRARSASGASVSVRAQLFVLAAGGIETARLLLWLCETLRAHAKLPWLGHGYMGHLGGIIAEITLAPGTIGALDYARDETVCYVRRRLAPTPELLREGALLSISFHIDNPPLRDPGHRSAGLSAIALALGLPGLGGLVMPGPMGAVLLGAPLRPRETVAHAANVLRAPWDAAAFGLAALQGRLSRPVRPGLISRNGAERYALRFSGEELARFGNAVRLSNVRDAHGVPRIAIARQIDPFDIDSVLRAHEALDRALQQSGIARLDMVQPASERAQSVRDQSGDGFHQIGLTRMSDSAATGVVDTNARVHGFPNLYVAGSATFPTSSHANPTFMIVCQALRLADHLSGRLTARIRAGASPS